MKRETIQFVVEAKNGVVEQVGKSSISEPETNFDHKGIKWFDDSKLLKGDVYKRQLLAVHTSGFPHPLSFY